MTELKFNLLENISSIIIINFCEVLFEIFLLSMVGRQPNLLEKQNFQKTFSFNAKLLKTSTNLKMIVWNLLQMLQRQRIRKSR